MNFSIFHSVNAGLLLKTASRAILIDGLHSGKEQGFSDFPDGLLVQMRMQSGIFSQVDAALFTHLHADHYDAALLDEFSSIHSRASVWGPQLPASACCEVPHSPAVASLSLFPDDIEILAIHTTHDGAAFQETPHVSYLLRSGDSSVLVAGDARLTDGDIATISALLNRPLDAAFFIPYQFITTAGADAIRALDTKKIYLYHLPFPADDVRSTARLADHVIRHMKNRFPSMEAAPLMTWL